MEQPSRGPFGNISHHGPFNDDILTPPHDIPRDVVDIMIQHVVSVCNVLLPQDHKSPTAEVEIGANKRNTATQLHNFFTQRDQIELVKRFIAESKHAVLFVRMIREGNQSIPAPENYDTSDDDDDDEHESSDTETIADESNPSEG